MNFQNKYLEYQLLTPAWFAGVYLVIQPKYERSNLMFTPEQVCQN